ncbi:MAG: hypothetical protein ACK4E7_03740 [Permianibacter sp.]
MGLLIGLATAALILPVFFAREYFGVDESVALNQVLPASTYFSWASLGCSIISGVIFHFFSAKWVRLAWEQPVEFAGKALTEHAVERILEWTLWLCILGFMLGVALTVFFLSSYVPKP